MDKKQFEKHLIGLARGAIYARGLLQSVVEHELDAQVCAEYEFDIETIILDLNNVVRDCAFLARLIQKLDDDE